MQMSQEGREALLQKFEGCKLKAYRCPANVCTIGYGHTSAAGTPTVIDGMTITQQQADDILSRDLQQYEAAVTMMVHQPLTQHQFDVLVDFAYNAGVGNLKSSTLLKKVNAARFDDVPTELLKWNKGGGKVLPGLVRRRQAEGAWWVSGEHVDEHEQRADPDPVPVRTMADSKQGNAALVTAGLGGLGAAKEVAAQAQDASDTANQFVGLLSNTNFLIMSAIIALAAAIWFFRKKHMEEHNV
jgi:lysozyme